MVNSMHAPSYKIAKFIHKTLSDKLTLTNKFKVHNSTQVTIEINNMEM